MDAVIRDLAIEGVAYPVVVVMPAGFSFPQNADVWVTFERRPNPNRSRTVDPLSTLRAQ